MTVDAPSRARHTVDRPERERPLHEVWLVIRRELLTTMATRRFVVGTAFLLVVLSGYLMFSAPAGLQETTVAVTSPTSNLQEELQAELLAAAGDDGPDTVVRAYPDAAAAIEAVRANEAAAAVAVTPDGRVEVTVLHLLDAGLEAALEDVARQRAVEAELVANGVDPAAVAATVADQAVSVVALEPTDVEDSIRLSAGLMAAVLIYFSLLMYGSGLAQGVVEEKCSRVVELLLSTIRPWQLLMGKVIGVGISGLVQLSLLAGVGLGAAALSGPLRMPASVVGTVLWGIVWYLLGFLLYATLMAAAASTVSRQEDVPSAFQPMVLLMGAPFVAGILLATNDPEGALFEALSLVPLFSPIMMPIRIGLETVPWWQNVLAVVLTIGLIGAVAKLAGRVYANSVLRSGSRVGMRQALGLGKHV